MVCEAADLQSAGHGTHTQTCTHTRLMDSHESLSVFSINSAYCWDKKEESPPTPTISISLKYKLKFQRIMQTLNP